MDQKCSKEGMLLDLGFAGLTTSMRKHQIIRVRNHRVAVENTSLVQNGKEVDALKSSKEQHYVFA